VIANVKIASSPITCAEMALYELLVKILTLAITSLTLVSLWTTSDMIFWHYEDVFMWFFSF